MIDVLMKLNSYQTIIISSDGKIYYYEYSVEEIMNIYLKPLLLSFDIIRNASKGILDENKYKRPIAYYSYQGLNILIPLSSYKKESCCWVSLNYCMNHTLKEFNDLTKKNITNFQWGKLITTALNYKNIFDLNIMIPECGTILTKEEMHSKISINL